MSKPILVGIVGDACSGKSALAGGLQRVFGPERAVVVGLDEYRRVDRAERHARGWARVQPDLYYQDVIAQHLALLRNGEPVLKPTYSRTSGRFEAPSYVETRPVIIAEGLFGFYTAEQRDEFDLKIYVEPQEALRSAWKVRRDVLIRKRSDADVRREIQQWRLLAEQHVVPQVRWADIVLRLTPPPGDKNCEQPPDLSLIVRPTAAESHLFELVNSVGSVPGIKLELARDMGLPVDRLDVAGGVVEEGLDAYRKLFWKHIARTRAEIRDNELGCLTDVRGQVVYQPALAFAQLFLSYQINKIGIGHK